MVLGIPSHGRRVSRGSGRGHYCGDSCLSATAYRRYTTGNRRAGRFLLLLAAAATWPEASSIYALVHAGARLLCLLCTDCRSRGMDLGALRDIWCFVCDCPLPLPPVPLQDGFRVSA